LLTARAGSGAGCDGAVDSGPGRVSPRACCSRKSSSGVSAARRAGVLGVDDRFAPAAAAVGDECCRRGSGPGRVPDGGTQGRRQGSTASLSSSACLRRLHHAPLRRNAHLPPMLKGSLCRRTGNHKSLAIYSVAESCPGHGPRQEGARSCVVLDPELLSLTQASLRVQLYHKVCDPQIPMMSLLTTYLVSLASPAQSARSASTLSP
jgi:hypothetical protein